VSIPDRIGVWRLTLHDGEVLEFDVYELPTGHLCAWCVDVGLSGGIDDSLVWDTDEWVGHVPVCVMDTWGIFDFVA